MNTEITQEVSMENKAVNLQREPKASLRDNIKKYYIYFVLALVVVISGFAVMKYKRKF